MVVKKIVDWYKTNKDIINRTVKRTVATTLMAAEYLALRGFFIEGPEIKPDIVVAGIPIYHITNIGHASSDEILKYRSMGGIFLAHQKGGKDTFKFTAKIFGPMRFITYKALEAIQLFGVEELKPVTSLSESSQNIKWLDKKKNALKPLSLEDIGALGSPIIDYTRQDSLDNEQYSFHKTFPIITDTRIYQNMYLETLVYKESEQIGIDAIEIQCAFRKYIPPTKYATTVENEATKRKFYSVYIPSNIEKNLRLYENTLNFVWAMIMYEQEYQKMTEIKKQTGGPFADASMLALTYGAQLALTLAPTVWIK